MPDKKSEQTFRAQAGEVKGRLTGHCPLLFHPLKTGEISRLLDTGRNKTWKQSPFFHVARRKLACCRNRADSTITRIMYTHNLLLECEREDRLRVVFGLQGYHRIPRPDAQSLRQYFGYLTGRLVFPFAARCLEKAEAVKGMGNAVMVLALLDPVEHATKACHGLLCRIRGIPEVRLPLSELWIEEDSANHELIEDYWYWLWNWQTNGL